MVGGRGVCAVIWYMAKKRVTYTSYENILLYASKSSSGKSSGRHVNSTKYNMCAVKKACVYSKYKSE